MTKLKVGVYGVTGCAGCQLSVIFNEDEILDIIELVDLKAFPFIKEFNQDEEFDAVLCEGLVASQEDLDVVKKLRKNSKILVALGACAHTGCVPAYRHFTLKENYEHLLYKKRKNIKDIDPTPIDHHVKVDFTIPGCPPDKHEIKRFIKDLVLGKKPRRHGKPVCDECRKNKNCCLLDSGKPCLGPITEGGCNAVCINGGFECWGCRGPTKDMNLQLFVKMMRDRGFDDKFIADRLTTFCGLKMPIIKEVLKTMPEFKTKFKGKKVYFG